MKTIAQFNAPSVTQQSGYLTVEWLILVIFGVMFMLGMLAAVYDGFVDIWNAFEKHLDEIVSDINTEVNAADKQAVPNMYPFDTGTGSADNPEIS